MGFPEALYRTLKGCHKFDLGLVDEGLWRQSEIVMVNCQTTLNERGLLVIKIKGPFHSKEFKWKTRAVVDLIPTAMIQQHVMISFASPTLPCRLCFLGSPRELFEFFSPTS